MRETVEIARLLDQVAAHDGRKSQDLGIGLSLACDKSRQSLHDLFKQSCSCIDPVTAGRLKQQRADGGYTIFRTTHGLMKSRVEIWRFRFKQRVAQSLIVRGTSIIMVASDAFARMRSLLIITDADNTSRRCRPTLNFVSFR